MKKNTVLYIPLVIEQSWQLQVQFGKQVDMYICSYVKFAVLFLEKDLFCCLWGEQGMNWACNLEDSFVSWLMRVN